MFSFLKKSCPIAIDLGTSNTLIFSLDNGIVFDGPTCVAIDVRTNNVISVGSEAKAMEGKTPPHICVIHPLNQGAISDINATRLFLHHLMSTLFHFKVRKPNIAVSVPFDLSDIERRAVIDVLSQSDAKNVYLIQDPFSAALGSSLDLESKHGHLILDIGGGVSEISLLASNGVVTSSSIRIGGESFDRAIINYLKDEKRILIGHNDAEKIKKEFCKQSNYSTLIKAKDIHTRMPVIETIDSSVIQKAIEVPFRSITHFVTQFISQIPVSFADSILDNGIIATGGSSQLYGLQSHLTSHLNLDVHISQNPLMDIAFGAGKIISDSKHHELLQSNVA